MKVLLLGKTGLLGSAFEACLKAEGIEYQAPLRAELDLTDFVAVDRFLAHEYFDRILYCSAYTDVEQAEIEHGQCELLNTEALSHILNHRSPVIYFSTDYVFSAPAGAEIIEDTPRKPINFYGKTKANAEKILEQSGKPFWNIRTSWLFGPGGNNFITKIRQKSHDQDVLEIVEDQVGRPTYTLDLAQAVFDNFIKETPLSGHYHLQNTGTPVSWAGLAEYVLEKDHWHGQVKRIQTKDIIPPLKAARPVNSIFKNTKLKTDLRGWHEAVDAFLDSES
jgi:dTDP-4-dehydrorhamnose reductase